MCSRKVKLTYLLCEYYVGKWVCYSVQYVHFTSCVFVSVEDRIIGIFVAHTLLREGAASLLPARPAVQQESDLAHRGLRCLASSLLIQSLNLGCSNFDYILFCKGGNWLISLCKKKSLNVQFVKHVRIMSHSLPKVSFEKGFLISICFTVLGIKLYANWWRNSSKKIAK